MFVVNPVIVLVNGPVPVPSLVRLLAIVGFEVVLQQTPRAVTEAPPLDVTLPPEVAVVAVMLEAIAVDTVGEVCALT